MTRPGPRTRQRLDADVVLNQRQEWRDRQRRSRWQRTIVDGGSASNGEANATPDLRWGCRRHRSSVWRSASRITRSLSRLLQRIPDSNFRAAVLEKVFSNHNIRPLLPSYYPTPEEARAQRQILLNIKAELAAMKLPNTSGMLARKRAILEAVVSELDSDMSMFHSILGTRKENLLAAVERLRSATTESSSRFAVPARRRREGGICNEIKQLVLQWWTEETRVSPGRRDVRRKRLGRNSYDTHAAHLLMESQVQSS